MQDDMMQHGCRDNSMIDDRDTHGLTGQLGQLCQFGTMMSSIPSNMKACLGGCGNRLLSDQKVLPGRQGTLIDPSDQQVFLGGTNHGSIGIGQFDTIVGFIIVTGRDHASHVIIITIRLLLLLLDGPSFVCCCVTW